MKSKSLLFLSLLSVSILLLAGCSQQEIDRGGVDSVQDAEGVVLGESGDSLKIVTTFPPLYAHTANLVDQNDALTNLVPPGTSIHTRQPKPSDILAMEEADMILINGLGLEEFLVDYLDSLDNAGVMIVDTSKGAALIEQGEEEEHEGEQHEKHEGHHHEGPDPHIWLSPKNAQLQVSNILEALISLDPSQKDFYTEQAGLYKNDLSSLDTRISNEISTTQKKPFIVFHDAYQYFLRSYDLYEFQVGLVQEFHGDNPSQKDIVDLIEVVEVNGVDAIYIEPQFNPSTVLRLEEEIGINVKEIDPIGESLTQEGYIRMIENLSKAFILE